MASRVNSRILLALFDFQNLFLHFRRWDRCSGLKKHTSILTTPISHPTRTTIQRLPYFKSELYQRPQIVEVGAGRTGGITVVGVVVEILLNATNNSRLLLLVVSCLPRLLFKVIETPPLDGYTFHRLPLMCGTCQVNSFGLPQIHSLSQPKNTLEIRAYPIQAAHAFLVAGPHQLYILFSAWLSLDIGLFINLMWKIHFLTVISRRLSTCISHQVSKIPSI